MKTSTNPYRLSRDVVPSAYRIFLTPDLEAATFAGSIEIDVDVNESRPDLTLHAKDLALGAATVTGAGTSHRSLEAVFDETYETVTFQFDPALPLGPATLEIA